MSVRRDVAWALTGMPTPGARRARATIPPRHQRRGAGRGVQLVALWRDALAFEAVQGLLRSDSPGRTARLAATALGRIGASLAVSNLLAARRRGDRALEHALTYALIEIAEPTATAQGLVSASMDAQRLALVALDQMRGGGLKVENVLLLTATNSSIQETARMDYQP